MQSWIHIAADSDFSIHNVPFGIFRTSRTSPRAATRLGNYVVDLQALAGFGYFKNILADTSVLAQPTLNKLIALGKPITNALRQRIISLFDSQNTELQNNAQVLEKVLFDISKVQMLLPIEIGDYTDFYSSIEHASNVGKMFRDPNNPLLPNWRHVPIGYHGRSSSIVVSGTPIRRPKGQLKLSEAEPPIFAPTRQFDFELEVAFVIGKETQLGQTVSVQQAEEYIFGLLLFNDHSARDIQRWEYVPLGPFLGKNFGSSVSPWIVTLEALEPFRVEGVKQEPQPLPYLQYQGNKNYDIQLEVFIQPQQSKASKVCTSNFRYMYWNMCQQLAHHTSNGCNIRVGDMYASGTISGSAPDSFGSLLELTWGGKNPLTLSDGSQRTYLADNDTVIMRGFAQQGNIRVGFGEVSATILEANF